MTALPELEGYPPWARTLSDHYLGAKAHCFLLTGAVRTTFTTPGQDPKPLGRFLAEELFASRDVVLFYDRSAGIRGANEASARDFKEAMRANDRLFSTNYANESPRAPGPALQLLENYLRTAISANTSMLVVVDYVDFLAPAGSQLELGAEDRFSLVTLLRWSRDAQFASSDMTLVLVADDAALVSSRLLQAESVMHLQLA